MVVRSLLTMLGFDVDPKGINRYNAALKGVLKTTAIIGTVGATAIGAMGTAFLKGAGNIEQAEIAFETMLGSMEKAQSLLKDITQFAEKTPFELVGLIQSSKQLLAFGIAGDKIIETMTNLGNISAGVGRDKLPTLVRAFGKIRTKGKASMEELNMLLEAGVPIMDSLAKQLNMKVGPALFKVIEKGQVGFKDVDQALRDLSTGSGMFANLMIKQSKSFLGILSNVKDQITNIVNSIGKDLLPEAKRLALVFLQWLDVNKEIMKSNIVRFYKRVFEIINKVVNVFKKFAIIGNIGDLFKFIISIIKMFGKTIDEVFGRKGKGVVELLSEWVFLNRKLIASKIVKFVKGLNKVFKVLLKTVKNLWPVLLGIFAGIKAFSIIKSATGIVTGLIAAFSAIASPAGIAALAIGALVTAAILIIKNWDKIKPVLISVGEILKNVFMGIGSAIGGFFVGIVTKVKEVINKIKQLWIDYITSWKQLFIDTGNQLLFLFEKAKTIAMKIKDVFTNIVETIGNVIKTVIDKITSFIDLLLTPIKAVIDKIIGSIDLLLTPIQTAFELLSKIAEKFEIFDKLRGLVGKGKDFFGGGGAFGGAGATGAIPPSTSNRNSSNTNNVTVKAEITVPPGTPKQQQEFLQKSADSIFTTDLQKFLNNGTTGIPSMEAF